MSSDRSVTDGTFWALVMLLTDHCVLTSARGLRALSPLSSALPRRTRIGVPVRRRWTLDAAARAVARIARQGMRPVVGVPASALRDAGLADRVLRRLADAGARDLVVRYPEAAPLVDVLDQSVRLVTSPGLVLRGFSNVTITGLGDRLPADPAADVLAKWDELHVASEYGAVAVDLRAPVGDAGQLLRWERALRAHGNRLAVRAVVAAGSPERLGAQAVRLATMIDDDPGSLLLGTDVVVHGQRRRTCHWASTVADGHFVVDGVPGHERRVRLLPAGPQSGPGRRATG